MTTHALMELAERLSAEADLRWKRPDKCNMHVHGEKMRGLLTEAATQLRTAAAEGGEARSGTGCVMFQLEDVTNVPVVWVDPYELMMVREHGGMIVATHEAEPEWKRTQGLYYHPPTDSGAGRDGERYRWLRDNCTVGSFSTYDPPFRLNCDEPASEWDAAIDAAMKDDTATSGAAIQGGG